MKDWTMARILIIALLVALGLTLYYKGPALTGKGTTNSPRVIAIFKMTDFSNSFWRSVRDGALTAAKDEHIQLQIRGPLDEKYIEEQIRILDEAIEEKPNAIILAAADYNRLIAGVKRATIRGIPVITIDSFIDSNDAVCKIGTNNLEAGRACARALSTMVRPEAVVAIMSYIRGSSSAIDRELGCRQVLDSVYKLLPIEYGNSDSELSYQQAKRLLATHPNLSGIVALNEPTVLGAARALRESGKAQQVVLVGVDKSFELLKFIEAGVVRHIIVQQPFNMGYLGVATVRPVMAGVKVEAFRNTGIVDINRETMFTPQNQKLLFPVSDAFQ